MGITGYAVTQAATYVKNRPRKSTGGSPRVATAERDFAVISKRARDLAALAAKKSASEESSELMAAKAQEVSESARAQEASKVKE